MSEHERCLSDWDVLFRRGTDFDLWGQPLEAIDCYSKLAAQLREYCHSEHTLFTDEQKKVLGKTASCLEMRCKSLQRPGRLEGISLEDLKVVEYSLQTMLTTNEKATFPLPVSAVPHNSRPSPEHNTMLLASHHESNDKLSDDEKEVEKLEQKSLGTLLPPPQPIPGQTLVTIRIEKIVLKEATQYMDPFITISVKDATGRAMTDSQDTPLAAHKEDTAIIFGADVYIQRPLEVLPTGFAIFYEFKHYKHKKRIVSTKCWAFMERDEIKEGHVALELYRKPTDFKRRKINLLTVKPLYLHLKVTLN